MNLTRKPRHSIHGTRLLTASRRKLVVSTCSAFFLLFSSSSPAFEKGNATRTAWRDRVDHRPKVTEIVVVMTWDGVRWQEILNGVDPRFGKNGVPGQGFDSSPKSIVPNLYMIAKSGGTLLGGDDALVKASSPSTVSLPGYTEIFSGRTPLCASNDCGPTNVDTLLDNWHVTRPEARLAVISSWSKIAYAAAKHTEGLDLSTGRLRVNNAAAFCATSELCAALNVGKHATPWPGADDYRPDNATARVALAYLRAHKPNFAFIGLGDTDEHAHHNDYSRYLAAIHDADATLGAVYDWLKEQERMGTRTLLIVTADHGRSNGFAQHTNCPEAARVWALVAGSGVTARARRSTGQYRLADIAPTIRDFAGLAPDAAKTAGLSLFDSRSIWSRLDDSALAVH